MKTILICIAACLAFVTGRSDTITFAALSESGYHAYAWLEDWSDVVDIGEVSGNVPFDSAPGERTWGYDIMFAKSPTDIQVAISGDGTLSCPVFDWQNWGDGRNVDVGIFSPQYAYPTGDPKVLWLRVGFNLGTDGVVPSAFWHCGGCPSLVSATGKGHNK